jgi:Na+/H+ antiporter NhaA
VGQAQLAELGHRRLSQRSTWARSVAAPVREFLAAETGGAAALLGAAIAALVWANLPWHHTYESVWTTRLSIRLGDAGISLDLRTWVNEGLMTFFFLVVGLEAKRERDVGQLRDHRTLGIPLIAALGGMALPVAIYLAFNLGGAGAHGWGAAMSTDTAFALGVLALVAPGGTRLRVGMLTLAIFDDLVALIVIATVYAKHPRAVPLMVAGGLFVVLVALRYAPSAWRVKAAAAVGVAFWVALYKSRIDPVIAGLAFGLVTSAYPPQRAELERVVELTRSFREQPTPRRAYSARRSVSSAISLNERLQHRLHPWTSFAIVPLFALANTGIHIDAGLLGGAISSPITLGIAAAYVVGKPLGILGSVALARWLRVGRRALSWPVIAGAGTVAGIGFTVSLLISSLAFDGRELEEAKLGVLVAGAVAAVDGWGVFRLISHLPEPIRARQIAGAAEEIVDLSDDVDPGRDHIRGADDAPVTLVEYGDYECPYCGQAEAVVRELLLSFGHDLRYVWRHLPLSEVHPNAHLAAEAAEAAGAQGAFWEMHDRLFEHQDQLSAVDLAFHAEALGLDADRLRRDLDLRTYDQRVAEDVASADASGVAGTPTFFVNGKRHQRDYDLDTLSAAVRAAQMRAAPVSRSRQTAGRR